MSIKIYLGTETGQWLTSEVLKSSIRRRTKADVEFYETRIFPLHIKSRVNIGLSLYRFYIPEAVGFSGKAIYMDAQALCLGNIEELFDLELKDVGALARSIDALHTARYTNVMLLNCENLKNWKIREWTKLIDKDPALLREYTGVTSRSPIAKDFGDLPKEWNALDLNEYKNGKILFFNDLSSQPWLNKDHPQHKLYMDELNYAQEQGLLPSDALEHEIQQGRLVQT